jgi:hypothetical protein
MNKLVTYFVFTMMMGISFVPLYGSTHQTDQIVRDFAKNFASRWSFLCVAGVTMQIDDNGEFYLVSPGGARVTGDALKICFNCMEQKEKLFACNGCHFMVYCSPECQKVSWKAGHKNVCPGVKKNKK